MLEEDHWLAAPAGRHHGNHQANSGFPSALNATISCRSAIRDRWTLVGLMGP